MPRRNPYLVLGVPEGASAEAIAKRFRELSFAHHPDRNPGNAAAAARMVEIIAAYEELKAPERRAALDRELQRSRSPGPTGLDKLRKIILEAHTWFTHDPIGRIVAKGIENALKGQGSSTPSPRPRAGAEAPSPAPPSASTKGASVKKKSASVKKKSASTKSATKRRAPRR